MKRKETEEPSLNGAVEGHTSEYNVNSWAGFWNRKQTEGKLAWNLYLTKSVY